MNICGEYHDEVCYEGRICPVCEVIKEKEELQDEVDKLKEDLQFYENEKKGI